MTLRELVKRREAELCERWLDAVFAEYGEEAAVLFRRERDPFANPVGHMFRTHAPGLIQAVFEEEEPSKATADALEAILRVRSVQELAPSRAVSFVYRLRDVICLAAAQQGPLSADLAVLERRIERLALLAFDIYVRLREHVFRLRQQELKRSVATLLRRWGGSPSDEPDAAAHFPLAILPSGDR